MSKLKRGLYEFTREYGMNDFAWVNSKGRVFPIDESISVSEFERALQLGVVYRLGRIEEQVRGKVTPISNPEESYAPL